MCGNPYFSATENGYSYIINNKSSAVAEMGDRDHNRNGPKTGLLCPFRGGAEFPSNTMWPGPRSTRDVVSRPWSWSLGASRTWKMVLVLVLTKKSGYFHDVDEW